MNFSLELNNFMGHLIFYSLIILITYLLLRIFYFKTKANFRYRAWIVILLLTILPFTINVSLNNNNNIISYKEDLFTNIEENSVVVNQIEAINISQYLFYFYLFSIVVILTYQLYRYYIFNKLINRWSTKIDNPNITNKFNEIIEELGLEKRNISLIKVKGITTPLSTRIFKPIIILPEHIDNEDEIYYILKHEAIHIKRYDIIIKYVSMIVLSIFWFNPLIYLLVKKIDIECETSCDALVVKNQSIESKKSYLETIINTISNEKAYLYSTQFLGESKDLKNRIESLLHPIKHYRGFTLMIVTIIFVSSSFLAVNANETKAIINNKTLDTSTNEKEISKNPNKKKKDNQLRNKLLSLDEARNIALAQSGGGYIDEYEYEVENGVPIYEFEIENGNMEYSISINLINGNIHAFETEYDD